LPASVAAPLAFPHFH